MQSGDSSQPSPLVPVERAEQRAGPSQAKGDGGPRATLVAGAEAQVQAIHQVEISSGPLPHPQLFQAYDVTLPGAAERILRMAETEQQHRHDEQSVRTRSDIALESRGQWMAFLAVMAGMIGGIALIALGKSIEGSVAVISAVSAVAGLSVWSRRRRAVEPSPNALQSPSQEAARPPTPSD